MPKHIEHVIAAIEFIEDHLAEKLDLDLIAQAVHYSKYHLHRSFTDTVGVTVHDYVQRRQLTEAAKLLVFSDKPIIEIALSAGYESQQAFAAVFKAMYKKTPNRYREEEEFYPLQLKYVLERKLVQPNTAISWQNDITFASVDDIPAWIKLVRLVIDGFPHLDEEEYVKQLHPAIEQKQALILKAEKNAIGIMIFNRKTGSIDFLGVHPQYRKLGITEAFLRKVFEELSTYTSVSITTFRENDKADPGYRAEFLNLGFAEAELLTEFGYPTQRFILHREKLEEDTDNE